MSQMLQGLKGRRVILAAGMNRSGSTLLYNLLRISLECHAGGERLRRLLGKRLRFECGYIDDFEHFHDAEVYLIKTHRLPLELIEMSEAVFYSFRDVRETLVSQYVKFGTELSVDFIDQQIQSYIDAKRSGATLFSYEDLCQNKMRSLETIGKVLGFEINSEEVLAALPEFRSKRTASGGYDKRTLLHDNHGSGTKKDEWRTLFPESLVAEIRRKYLWWFEEAGYAW